jgi:hypothetical protein
MKSMKLLFIVVFLAWMITVFFGCQQGNRNMNELDSPEVAIYSEDELPMLHTEK